jgi:hypothetical protein
VDLFIAGGLSQCKAYSLTGIPHYYYRQFKVTIKKVNDIQNGDSLAPSKTNGTARKIHPGRPSTLGIIWEELSGLVFEMRQKGIPVVRGGILPSPFIQEQDNRGKEESNHSLHQAIGAHLLHCYPHILETFPREREKKSPSIHCNDEAQDHGEGSMQHHKHVPKPQFLTPTILARRSRKKEQTQCVFVHQQMTPSQ